MRTSDWSSDVCSSDLIALSVSAHSELAGARIPSDKLAARNAHLTAVHRPNGIALQMAMVAADEADMAASLRWGNEWDIAAAALIVTEAGGKVTDALGKDRKSVV